jgi:hypothetical protein
MSNRNRAWVPLAFVVIAACEPSPSEVDAGRASDAGSTRDGGEKDAANLPEDGGADAGMRALSIGANVVAQRRYATGPETGMLATSAVETHTGSILLASIARGTWSTAPDSPSDDHGNGFDPLGDTHAYEAWPTARTGLYAAIDAAGGANHVFSVTWGDIGGTGDEVSLSVVEVRGATSIEDESWVERSGASSITSGDVTTRGPAILVAWWWGSGGVREEGELHVAEPGDGFAIVTGASALASLGRSGYIQVAVAQRVVSEAGTYRVTWTTDGEGAQLYLVALAP